MRNKKSITIQTELNLSECLERLQQENPVEFNPFQYPAGFRISLVGNKFKVSKVTQLYNIFKPIFSGNVLSEDGRTIVSGHFYTMLPVKIYFGIWLGIVTIITIILWPIMFLMTIAGDGPPPDFWPVIIGLPLFHYGIALSIIFIGRWLARFDKAQIIELLENLLETKIN